MASKNNSLKCQGEKAESDNASYSVLLLAFGPHRAHLVGWLLLERETCYLKQLKVGQLSLSKKIQDILGKRDFLPMNVPAPKPVPKNVGTPEVAGAELQGVS